MLEARFGKQYKVYSDKTWKLVPNAKGEISYSEARCGGDYLQKNLLEQEGIEFMKGDRNLIVSISDKRNFEQF